MAKSFLSEDDSVDVTVFGPDGSVNHESWDIIDLMDWGYTFDNMVADYKNVARAKKVVITIEFGE